MGRNNSITYYCPLHMYVHKMLLILTILVTLIPISVKGQAPLASIRIGHPKSVAASYLLPRNVRPSLYRISLDPNFDTDTFNGSIRIKISALSTTKEVVLHQYQLNIDENSIRLLDTNGIVVNSVVGTTYSNNDKQFYTITFRDDLEQFKEYILVIGYFSGILNDENTGFYLAKYTDENGIKRKLAVTKFEATSARRAFPCFDEPALKAEFEITIIRPAGYSSISNNPQISTEEISQNRYRDKFSRTVRMSTYLVAFVVSDFGYVSHLNHRVFLRPSLIANGLGDYALRIGLDTLAAISEFVNVSYTLDKMDQIGLPEGYFTAGAMENWGLVTYREKYLLYSKDITDSNRKQRIINIISHEFGHQWFGNLVSPAWWTYLWLNEGFATYFGYYASSVVAEDVESMEQMVVKVVQYALLRDSTKSTRPINQDVGSPTDIASIFDAIAYDKAASVIRMVEGIISTDVFRKGLNIYLNRMQFQAAQPIHLYMAWQRALDEAGIDPFPKNKDIASFMATWTDQAGYPLVTVKRNCISGSITFSQRRFLTATPQNNDRSIWYVPISYVISSNANFSNLKPKFWLTNRRLKISSPSKLTPGDCILLNIQQTGFYRVNYDEKSWRCISSFLDSGKYYQVHKLNRAQLLNDAYILARYGVVDFSTPLNLIRYVKRETDYIPLYSFFEFLGFLDTFMSNTDRYGDFKIFILSLLNTAMNSVGCNEKQNNRHVTKLNRINLLSWTDKYGRHECRQEGLVVLRAWRKHEEYLTIPPNMQSSLICAALRIGEQNDWDFVFGKYAKENESQIHERLLSSLGCSEDKDILDRFMDIILDGTDLKLKDRERALSSIYKSGLFGRDYLYNYVKVNWERIESSLTYLEIKSMIEGIGEKFSTLVQRNDLRIFGKRVGHSFHSVLSTIEENIKWADKYLPSVLKWFDANL